MMACCYLENLKQRKQRKSQRWGCQDLKNFIGLQVISSMLENSTIYFYTDKVFSKRLPVWSPPAGSLGCWNLATSCLSVQDTGLHSGVPGSPLDPDHRVTREIANIVVLPVEMFNDIHPFSFLMWVKCGAQRWFLQEMYILTPTGGWAPCPMMTDPAYEWPVPAGRPSLNLTKFCLHGRFRPLQVLSALMMFMLCSKPVSPNRPREQVHHRNAKTRREFISSTLGLKSHPTQGNLTRAPNKGVWRLIYRQFFVSVTGVAGITWLARQHERISCLFLVNMTQVLEPVVWSLTKSLTVIQWKWQIRFKGFDLIDRVTEELCMEVHDIVQ